MTPLLQKCINNNTSLYEAVFRPLGIGHIQTDSIWYTLKQTPPLHSNLITLSPMWRPDRLFHDINFGFISTGWDRWSIKDSFGVLDLTGHRFFKLFDAKWIYLDISKFKPAGSGGLKYKIVKTAGDLDKWRLAWNTDEQPGIGKSIFSDAMLDDPDIWFVAGYDGDSLLSGCLVNASDDVLGISNFFGPEDNWSDTISFTRDSIKSADIVGYEQEFGKFEGLGFDSPGPLSVWVKRTHA
jgi:hypothetical protein